MARIYEYITKSGNVIGLYERPHNACMPYVVRTKFALGGFRDVEVDFFADAYREYNDAIRKEVI